ncbi:MAG: response regulator transcription factor [Chloroflexi bacterium]|nr:response regulator transcription factor [Chloroflexota bacterium]MBI4328753.1 response regulator transcription factor [Chloroflexota bacterium]
MEKIRVLIVDDHALVRRGVVGVLSEQEDIAVIGEATNGAQGVEMARTLAPQVVIMDLQMPGISGLEATSVIHSEMPEVQILVFTVSESEADLLAAVKYGAKGYILKNVAADELVQTIHLIAQGGVVVSPGMAAKLLTELSQAAPAREQRGEVAEGLSAREREVLELVARGSTNSEIASSLYISENTVKTHLRNILDKLHLANRSQAVAYAARLGLGRPSSS